ncbi:MAG: hypothetical protein A2487_18985 [Candidatus Raymondbacteria bacterium RifOxyC12_full_50_8]|uniref:Transposase IS200-like domain-containing protein n=1 Tax=Candidatus Raymondbacteria bacterium RIFOXYD12_FULL_49_13 TaxID=1817890 RepID=A0A1F7F9J4_UNCRA|nr:MAG: hypothetical protein A2350_06780 [Candidatus Raymondbacteria bacterium RifOxyB12_full_50_8]OGJ93220.1 MAG: hypothetical protein A2248_17780 [Candidatus Raymondbacteria bacterium RIFOXYA2_FULL_49_16]OGK03303.1 MAG: hypothetical protein A2519_15125 [Candidatus Raymondbacteria bacterium RIFOXYD12_FULL_49_13]OGK07424.1 MAG: hypothetical protein A2487_18985 [Candidatus Raymondbacteria bacterium RifOxyC12_full_50_8]OGP44942.1 MAG: hypothetical protein A2324_19705 [Candidatus Raymondbacteria b
MEKSNSELHHRRSIRLKGYDYSRPGTYYITICTQNTPCVLACAPNGQMKLTTIGKIVHQYWMEIPNHYPNASLDEFVVMPNHIHGILVLHDGNKFNAGTPNDENTKHIHSPVGVQNFEPLQTPGNGHRPGPQTKHEYQHIIPKSVGSIIRAYKSAVTLWCRKNGHHDFSWQRNFYEHIVRNDISLFFIRNYIRTNPLELMEKVIHKTLEIPE